MLRFNNVLSMERLWHQPVVVVVASQQSRIVTVTTPRLATAKSHDSQICGTLSVPPKATIVEEAATTDQINDAANLHTTPFKDNVSVGVSSLSPVAARMDDDQTVNNIDDLQRDEETAIESNQSPSTTTTTTTTTAAEIETESLEKKEADTKIKGSSDKVATATAIEEEPITTLSVSSSSSISTPQTPSSPDSLLQKHYQQRRQQQEKQQQQQIQQQQQQQHNHGYSDSFDKFKSQNTTTSLFRRETTKLNQRRKSFTRKIRRVLSQSKLNNKRHSM